MATNTNSSAATIKFFRPADSSSSSDSADDGSEEEGTSSINKSTPTAKPKEIVDENRKNPFQSGSDLSDNEESIYIATSPGDTNYPTRSGRKRTDSDSNFLQAEEDNNELLILDMTDDHFGHPGDLSRLRDINQEIEKMKELIYMTPDDNPEKGRLIDKLIGLRLRKSELENPENSKGGDKSKTIYGHDFRLKEATAETERFCEVCCAVVWGVIHSWYTCSLCYICCHDKCLNSLRRMCASKRVIDSPAYVMTICRERGLHVQNYKCYECQSAISYKAGASEPRQCDYTGKYYCISCHWNDEAVIPARIIHNWDFQPRRICRASRQYLMLMYSRPVLCVERLNSFLPNYVEELGEMRKLRDEILLMKVYFLSCQTAMQSKILLRLEGRQHFVENADHYTMRDLVELVNEKLLPLTVNVHASFASHIKVECVTCRGKGYYCEICRKSEVIFPFDNVCVLCPECSNVFHKYCYSKVNQVCPRCERKRKRLEETERKSALLRQIDEASAK